MTGLTTESEWTTSDTEFYSCATSTGNYQIPIDTDDVDENGESYRKSRNAIKAMMLSAKVPIIEQKLVMKKWILPIKRF